MDLDWGRGFRNREEINKGVGCRVRVHLLVEVGNVRELDAHLGSRLRVEGWGLRVEGGGREVEG